MFFSWIAVIIFTRWLYLEWKTYLEWKVHLTTVNQTFGLRTYVTTSRNWPENRTLYKKCSYELMNPAFYPPDAYASQHIENSVKIAGDGSKWKVHNKRWRSVDTPN